MLERRTFRDRHFTRNPLIYHQTPRIQELIGSGNIHSPKRPRATADICDNRYA